MSRARGQPIIMHSHGGRGRRRNRKRSQALQTVTEHHHRVVPPGPSDLQCSCPAVRKVRDRAGPATTGPATARIRLDLSDLQPAAAALLPLPPESVDGANLMHRNEHEKYQNEEFALAGGRDWSFCKRAGGGFEWGAIPCVLNIGNGGTPVPCVA